MHAFEDQIVECEPQQQDEMESYSWIVELPELQSVMRCRAERVEDQQDDPQQIQQHFGVDAASVTTVVYAAEKQIDQEAAPRCGRRQHKLQRVQQAECTGAQRGGLAEFAARFARLDLCRGREVSVALADETVLGVARGLGPDGALMVESDGELKPYYAADVSLRSAKAASNAGRCSRRRW